MDRHDIEVTIVVVAVVAIYAAAFWAAVYVLTKLERTK